jgi:hypothetical protein
MFIINAPANINTIETITDEEKCSLPAYHQRIVTTCIKYITEDANTGYVSLEK